MYTLLYGLYKYLVQKEEYCVLILGLDNAGKTTYLEVAKTKFNKNYKGMNPSKITSTVGLNIGEITADSVKLNFWDLGGQEELQSLWDKYYAESHAIIFVVDSSDRERIPESKDIFDKMIGSSLLRGVPLLVLANKQDIPECMGVRDVKPVFNQSAHLIGRRDCMVMPVSALHGEGITEGIHWIIDCIKRNSVVRPPRNLDELEWQKENSHHLRQAEEHCKLAERIRAQSEQIRENVIQVLEKNKNETNKRFEERIIEEEYRRDEIERTRTHLQIELEPLSVVKGRILAALKSVESCALQITKNCLHLREGRIGIDLVNDEVEKALLQELRVIEEAIEIMKRCFGQVEETQRELRASLYLLNQDLRNKLTGLELDAEAMALKETHVGLSIYQGDQPLDPATITVEEWERFTDETLESASKKLHKSRELGVYIDTVLKQVELDLKKHDAAVNEAFRIRIEQVKFNKSKLENRHFEVVRQANEMSRNISELEKAISDKEGYLALAHTRLGIRAQRPGAELVRDKVNNSLSREVLDIRAVVAQLRQNLAQAEAVQRQLLQTQVLLEEDINIKINSLKIDDVDCMTLRQSIQHPIF